MTIVQLGLALLAGLLLLRTGIFVLFSTLHALENRSKKQKSASRAGITPSVSILVPCYNEELTLHNCVESLLKLNYPTYEILLINDGSSDRTGTVCDELALRYPERIRAFHKPNGGKSDALNHGLSYATGEVIVTIDADSIFLPNTLTNLVAPFEDSRIGGVGGNIKVANRDNLLGKLQAAEYIFGLNLYRRGFAQMNCMQIISGAIGAFRKQALTEVGGYHHDTLAEDMDLTIRLARGGYQIAYADDAIAYTEAPETLDGLSKQRHRWMIGGFQVLRKHADILTDTKHGTLGIVGLMYFLVSPWANIFIAITYALSATSALISGDGIAFLQLSCLWIFVQCILSLYAILIDSEDISLVLVAPIDTLLYSHLLTFHTVRAMIAHHTSNTTLVWEKIERLGKNTALLKTA